MTNRGEAANFREDDSIDTMVDGVELISISENSAIISHRKAKAKHKPISSVVTNNSQTDNKSITSSMMWETILSKQS